MRRKRIAAAAATLAIVAGTSTSARAGTYDVAACDFAPASAVNAWAPVTTDAALAAYPACPVGGDRRRGIVVRNAVGSGSVAQGATAQYVFSAPADTTI